MKMNTNHNSTKYFTVIYTKFWLFKKHLKIIINII